MPEAGHGAKRFFPTIKIAYYLEEGKREIVFIFWLQGFSPQKADMQKIMVLKRELRELGGGGQRGENEGPL